MIGFTYSRVFLTVGIATFLTACGGGENNEYGSSSLLGNALPGEAILSIDLVDAPVDSASNVFVNITGLQLQSPQQQLSFVYCIDESADATSNPVDTDTEATDTQGENTELSTESLNIPDTYDSTNEIPPFELLTEGATTDIDADAESHSSMQEHSTEQPACSEPETRTVDLLALTGGVAQRLLDGVAVPAGEYQWIRLQLADNPGTLVLEDGTEHDLVIPSGSQTGLKLNGGFEAHSESSNHLVLDFDLRKSVVKAGEKYLLKPTIKMMRIDDASVQTLTGNWAYTETDCLSPMVYLYEGADVIPDDIGGSESEPSVSFEMTEAEDGTGWTWVAPWLSTGDYTVAYTCDGASDEPESDNDLDFPVRYNDTVSGS